MDGVGEEQSQFEQADDLGTAAFVPTQWSVLRVMASLRGTRSVNTVGARYAGCQWRVWTGSLMTMG